MIKISKDGVSFLDINGKTKWNYAYNLKNPHIVKRGEYFAIVDRGYGDLYIFGKNGLEGHNKTLLPIMDAAISSYGDLYVILSDDPEIHAALQSLSVSAALFGKRYVIFAKDPVFFGR